jgi:hypothetical protein
MKDVIEKIKSDPRYKANVEYGKPRNGHPEGKVKSHISELEANLYKVVSFLTEEQFDKLLFLIHTHDTFKAESEKGVAISHHKSHASLARLFAAEFTTDKDLLNMIQYHDEGFALYRQVQSGKFYNKERLENLFRIIKDWDLFMMFNFIDNTTEGKDNYSSHWLLQEARKRALALKVSTEFVERIEQ